MRFFFSFTFIPLPEHWQVLFLISLSLLIWREKVAVFASNVNPNSWSFNCDQFLPGRLNILHLWGVQHLSIRMRWVICDAANVQHLDQCHRQACWEVGLYLLFPQSSFQRCRLFTCSADPRNYSRNPNMKIHSANKTPQPHPEKDLHGSDFIFSIHSQLFLSQSGRLELNTRRKEGWPVRVQDLDEKPLKGEQKA